MAYVVAQQLLAAGDPTVAGITVDSGGPVAIRGGEGLVINYGRCCGPIPGDPIVGHMTPGKGFVVHVETCPNMVEIRRRRGGRDIIPAHWAPGTRAEFLTFLRVDVHRKKGIIASIAAAVAEADAGVEAINVEERNSAVTSVSLDVSVRDRNHLARVLRRLRSTGQVVAINRVGA
jgi:GTP diphosphokinase / guanosine-3',5'-bis(diphosphate) 3'-diphosphatase